MRCRCHHEQGSTGVRPRVGHFFCLGRAPFVACAGLPHDFKAPERCVDVALLLERSFRFLQIELKLLDPVGFEHDVDLSIPPDHWL